MPAQADKLLLLTKVPQQPASWDPCWHAPIWERDVVLILIMWGIPRKDNDF